MLNLLEGSDGIAHDFNSGKIIPNLSLTWNINDLYEIYAKEYSEDIFIDERLMPLINFWILF